MCSVYLMIGFGLVGYFMKKLDYSFVTFLVGYVLGPMAELTIRQSLIISESDPAVLIDHPIAVLFLVLAVFSIWRFAIAGARSMRGAQPMIQEDPTRGGKPRRSKSTHESNTAPAPRRPP